MNKKKNKKANEGSPAPTASAASGASERIERRDYGDVLVKTLRSGVMIEQLMLPKTKTTKRAR
jgi:hypothetical protein